MIILMISARCPHPNPAPANVDSPTTDPVYPGQSLMYQCKTGHRLILGDLSLPCSMSAPYVLTGTPPVCACMYYVYGCLNVIVQTISLIM